MSIDNADLKLISLVIHEPGFKLIEAKFYEQKEGLNDVSRVNGNAFEDGKLRGEVASLKYVLGFIADLRKQIKQMGDD